jgi:hypothetical protein
MFTSKHLLLTLVDEDFLSALRDYGNSNYRREKQSEKRLSPTGATMRTLWRCRCIFGSLLVVLYDY